MWARKALTTLLLAVFIFSIFSVVNAARNPFVPVAPNGATLMRALPGPGNPNDHPWGGGNFKIATFNLIRISDSLCLTSIGNIPVVLKVEVKNQMPSEARRGR